MKFVGGAKTWCRDRRGLNLVEVVVAMFLFTLVLVATVWYFPRSALVIKRSEATMTAERLASDRLQELHAQQWDDLTPGLKPVETFTLNGVEFRRRVEIRPDEEGSDSLREVRIAVDWDQGGQPRQYRQISWLTSLTR